VDSLNSPKLENQSINSNQLTVESPGNIKNQSSKTKLYLILGIVFVAILGFIELTSPVLKSLKNCLDNINLEQRTVMIKIQNNQLTKNEIKEYDDKFQRDIKNCPINTSKKTGRPLFLAELIYDIGLNR